MRLARVKYIDNKFYPTYAEAVEVLMRDYIIKYFRSPFELQDFREMFLYTNEVDALLKRNLDSIKVLFDLYVGRKDRQEKVQNEKLAPYLNYKHVI